MLALRAIIAIGGLIAQCDAAVFGKPGKIEAVPKSASTLRGAVVSNATSVDVTRAFTAVNSTRSRSRNSPPCKCVSSSHDWTPCKRTTPRCVFIDLGAADGNTFEDFVHNEYGYTDNCPSGKWAAILVEANPRFDEKLSEERQKHKDSDVTVLSSTAAYMCEGTTSFYLDTVNTEKNFWGSSMSSDHPDVQRSGAQEKVTVPTMNLNRILYEQTIPGDWVMVKMDIEGSEFDVLPCLAKQDSPAALIDRLYLEQHSSSWGMVGTTDAEMESVKNELKFRGVDIPPYFSQTL